ncbi:MAG TPA: response regulator [Devosiaceae bacterium]|jgi:two-component system OmpR family response regulator|nr:response regulator [Devosiaceae bacterium]
MTTPHILIVEDDKDIGQLVAKYLKANEMRASIAENGRAMDRILADTRISLIVLDRMLPGEDGLSICRRLRATSDIPIIILTAQADEVERIVGLEMGADDYLGKPFSPRELLARIRAVLRRRDDARVGSTTPKRTYRFAGWVLDGAMRRLYDPQGTRVELTGAEFEVLLVFCERPGRTLSRDQIIDLTQGRDAAPSERSVDILISRLRRKLERDPKDPELLQTIRSSGYLFSPEVTSE